MNRVPFLAFYAAGILVAFIIADLFYEVRNRALYREIDQQSDNLSNEVHQLLNDRLVLLTSLEAFVGVSEIQHQQGDNIVNIDQDFATFSQALSRSTNGVMSLQLAPDAIVTHMSNPERNQAALGHDLLIDDTRRDQVLEAIERRSSVVVGPISLLQGGTGIIARKAIFLDPDLFPSRRLMLSGRISEEDEWISQIPDGFWGMATVVLDFDHMANSFADMAENFRYAIRGRHGLGDDGEVFFGSEEVFENETIDREIEFEGGSWLIAVEVAKPSFINNFLLPFLLVSALLSSFNFMLIRLYKSKNAAEYAALLDPLTRILNKSAIETALHAEVTAALSTQNNLSIIVFDIDDFKRINDDHGHQTGDAVINTLCEVITNNIRSSDIFGRIGGDEFIVICPFGTADSAMGLAARIQNSLSRTEFFRHVGFTLSFGISELKKKDTPEDIFQRADDALYHSKRDGKNQFSVI
ncbi:MAG: diguanylate cyclase [Bacteroidota bacterium]